MQHDSFVRARQAGWQRLEQLLRELDRRGWRSLQPAQLEELSSLYLQASSDLALAATHFPQGQTHRYLNSLVARSHARLYGVRTTSWCDILHFFWHQVPETFWRLRRAVLAASLLFVLGALAGAATATWQPDYAAALLPQQFRDVVAQGDVPEPGQHGMPLAEAPVLSTVIMLNNIQVAALSFALGVTAGLGTVYVLLQNGALLGVLAAVFQHQWALRFWSLILPHGLLELTAIFIAGGAGLHFAVGLIRPATCRAPSPWPGMVGRPSPWWWPPSPCWCWRASSRVSSPRRPSRPKSSSSWPPSAWCPWSCTSGPGAPTAGRAP